MKNSVSGEYASLVTLMSVAGAYISAETFNASGVLAVFVFGIVLGNKNSFGLSMEPQERRNSMTLSSPPP